MNEKLSLYSYNLIEYILAWLSIGYRRNGKVNPDYVAFCDKIESTYRFPVFLLFARLRIQPDFDNGRVKK